MVRQTGDLASFCGQSASVQSTHGLADPKEATSGIPKCVSFCVELTHGTLNGITSPSSGGHCHCGQSLSNLSMELVLGQMECPGSVKGFPF